MSDNVIGLRGQPILPTEPPNPELVKRLEELLEMARSGEVQGIVGAYVYRDYSTGSLTSGIVTHSLIGRTECVLLRAIKDLDGAP